MSEATTTQGSASDAFAVRSLRSGYSGVDVLHDLTLDFGQEIFAVLGANGAGKSTLLRTLAGLLRPTAGTIRLLGEPLVGLAAHEIARMGLSYVPQENNVFPDLSVSENLSLGGLVNPARKPAALDDVFDLFPDLAARASQKAGTLSGGEGQMVAIGRALMQEPKFLLLDEPTAGLAPVYVDNFFQRIRQIHDAKNVGIVLAEQNVVKTLEIADQVLVLHLGTIHTQGRVNEVSSEQIKTGYGI